MDVVHAAHGLDERFGEPLGRAVPHGAAQRDLTALHFHLDVARIQVGVIRERFARVLADRVVGALPALRALLHALVVEPRPRFALVEVRAVSRVVLALRRRIVAMVGIAPDLGMHARAAGVARVVDVIVPRVQVALVPVRRANLPRALVHATARELELIAAFDVGVALDRALRVAALLDAAPVLGLKHLVPAMVHGFAACEGRAAARCHRSKSTERQS